MILMSVVTLSSFRDDVGLDNVDELDECNGFDAFVSQRALDKFGDIDTVGAFEAQDDAHEGFSELMSTFSLLVRLRNPKTVTTLGM